MMSWCSPSLLLLCSHWTFTEVNMWILVRLFMVNFVQLAQLRTNWCIILRTIKSTSFLSKQIRRELFPYKFRIYIWWGQQKKNKRSFIMVTSDSSEELKWRYYYDDRENGRKGEWGDMIKWILYNFTSIREIAGVHPTCFLSVCPDGLLSLLK